MAGRGCCCLFSSKKCLHTSLCAVPHPWLPAAGGGTADISIALFLGTRSLSVSAVPTLTQTTDFSKHDLMCFKGEQAGH